MTENINSERMEIGSINYKLQKCFINLKFKIFSVLFRCLKGHDSGLNSVFLTLLQEAQFERLTRELEVERRSVASQLEKVCVFG